MSSLKYSDLKQRILDQRNEPIGIVGLKIELLEEALESESALIADPSQPLPFLIESGTVNLCAGIDSIEMLNQRNYPLMANNEAQLYNHLTDKDYRDMFANPGSMPFHIYVSEEEVLANAIPIPNTQTKKLTIGRHTSFQLNNVTFTLQYPIDFLVKSNGAIETVYNGRRPSNLLKLPGNKIPSRMIRLVNQGGVGGSIRCLRVPVTVQQMAMTPYFLEPDLSSILRATYNFQDKFFAVRAFHKKNVGTINEDWVEMHTTHSEQVFNVAIPTVLLRVLENTVSVELPHVYVLSGMVRSTIRIEVYTTKGDLYESFEAVGSDEIKTIYNDYDNDDGGIYMAPMLRLSTVSVEATSIPVSGGRDAPTFEERRDRVMRNTVYDNVMPISDAQVESVLKDLGFDSTMNIDTLTWRTYLATREMPVNQKGFSTTGVDTAMMTMRASFEQLKEYDTIKDNGDQMTVLPDTLYQDVMGELKIVPDSRRLVIDQLTGETLIDVLQENIYLTSPLHYVLDPIRDTFVARPYFLTDPKINITSYVASNDGLEIYVTSSPTMDITYKDTGYLLRVVTDSNAAYRALSDSQVFVQIAFYPEGDGEMTYDNGRLVGKTDNGERIFEFDIGTDWIITEDHKLRTNNFTQPGNTPSNYEVGLDSAFSLVWGVTDYSGSRSEVDAALGYHLLPSTALGIYHEELLITLGHELTGLWARSRAYMSTRKYKVYEEDVYAVWEKNVYHLVPGTNTPELIEVDGVKQLHKKYAKGTPKLDEVTGEPIIQHEKGSPVRIDGELVVESDRQTERWWEVALFDATYRYATRPGDVEYYQTIPRMLTTWINSVLGGVKDLLERTELYFHPKNTLRYFDVLVDDTELTTIYGAQSFVVTLYVDSSVYRNTTLRSTLEASAITALVKARDSRRVTKLGLEDAIATTLGSDVISVTVEGLGTPDRPASVITIPDETNRLSIKKRASLEPDGTIAIRDAVEIVFKLHSET